MSEEIRQTPLRNAAYRVAEAAKLMMSAVESEFLEMPVTLKLLGYAVRVSTGYKPEDGWTVNVNEVKKNT